MKKLPPENSDKPTFDLENCQDYAGALGIVASVRALFLLLLIVSLLTHAGAYSMAHWKADWTTPTSPQPPPNSAEPAEALPSLVAAQVDMELPETEQAPATTLPVRSGGISVDPLTVRHAIVLGLPVTAFVGTMSCIMLLLCYLLALNIELSGRLGGVQGTIAALFWMGVVLILLLPWGDWLGVSVIPLTGVFMQADDVLSLPHSFAGSAREIQHYARYLGYPLLTLLIVLVADQRYAKGYRLAQRQVEAWLHVKRI